MSYGERIAIFPGEAAVEEFSTLVHELAHEIVCEGTAVPVRTYGHQHRVTAKIVRDHIVFEGKLSHRGCAARLKEQVSDKIRVAIDHLPLQRRS